MHSVVACHIAQVQPAHSTGQRATDNGLWRGPVHKLLAARVQRCADFVAFFILFFYFLPDICFHFPPFTPCYPCALNADFDVTDEAFELLAFCSPTRW